MNQNLVNRLQSAQEHGRQKYGNGPNDFHHDDCHDINNWEDFIKAHFKELHEETDLDWCERLVKIAGLCCSGIESYERKNKIKNKSTKLRCILVGDRTEVVPERVAKQIEMLQEKLRAIERVLNPKPEQVF